MTRLFFAYKIMSNLCPNSPQGKFTTRSQISAYATRNCQDINIPKRNLEFSKKSFLYFGAKLWNDIPLDIRNSPTVLTSKKKLLTQSTVHRKSSTYLLILFLLDMVRCSFFILLSCISYYQLIGILWIKMIK